MRNSGSMTSIVSNQLAVAQNPKETKDLVIWTTDRFILFHFLGYFWTISTFLLEMHREKQTLTFLPFVNGTWQYVKPLFVHIFPTKNLGNYYWLVVSTCLKHIGQLGSFPQIGMNIKNIWNHHLDYHSSTWIKGDSKGAFPDPKPSFGVSHGLVAMKWITQGSMGRAVLDMAWTCRSGEASLVLGAGKLAGKKFSKEQQ